MERSELEKLLTGSKIVDVHFDMFFTDNSSVEGLTLEKDGNIYLVKAGSEPSYEGSTTDWLEITEAKTDERLDHPVR
jgi:hypothetical protein